MQTVRDNDAEEEELISRIRERLALHEEPYKEGAWEKFSALQPEEKRRPVLFWIGPLSAVAALLLVAGGLYLYTGDHTKTRLSPNNTDAAVAVPGALPPVAEAPVQAAAEGGKSPSVRPASTGAPNTPVYPSSSRESAIHPAQSQVSAPQLAQTNPVNRDDQRPLAGETPPAKVVAPATAGVSMKDPGQVDSGNPERKVGIEEFLRKESLAAAGKAVKENKAAADKVEKWELGVMVAPSIGNNNKLNMGYGLNMDYALSRKVSISSGISYNQLAGSGNVSAAGSASDYPSTSGFARESRTLESVEAKVTGIDIPLELKYRLSKSLYANVGVSAFAVINRNQQNRYVEEKLTQSTETLHSDNKDGFNTVVSTVRTVENVPESEIRQDKYIGFYNFSVGYKQKISGSKSISVEPFMKLPMKEVTRENLKLMGTGLRLKFDF